MTYESANGQLTGRNSERRKIANNTYLERRSDNKIAIRLHNTDILTFSPNGDITLDSGGWKTVTTKARMNDYLPCRIWSERGVWYVHLNGTKVPYADSMVIHSDGTITGQAEDPQGVMKLKRRIARYSQAFIEAFIAGEVPVPSNGDCWYCALRTAKVETVAIGNGIAKMASDFGTNGKTLGEAFRDTSHLEMHMEEKYYVPSLLARAIERFPVSQAANWLIGSKWDTAADEMTRKTAFKAGLVCKDQLQRSLRRYITEQFGMQA